MPTKNPLPDWARQPQRHAQRAGDHKPPANIATTLHALRTFPALRGIVANDEMRCRPMLMRPIPKWGEPPADAVGFIPRPFTDNDATAIQEWLQHAGLQRLGRDVMHQAVDRCAQECAFHPVRGYLDGLRWDGTPRVASWLTTHLGVQSSDYTGPIGLMFLVAMVARIYELGCKFDYVLVLEGPQGALKSAVCAILGGEWFSDDLPDLNVGKDVQQHVAGKWLIELPELAAIQGATMSRLKAFVSRREEIYRPSYGRKEVTQPRQCVFVGTTNDAGYLRDPTGGRRFWPVKVGAIDIDALRRDRDQIFAEAVMLYRHGTQWWPEPDFESEHIRPQQEARFEPDAWEEKIAAYLQPRERATVIEVAREVLKMDMARIGTHDQNRIRTCMKRCGWENAEKLAATGDGRIPRGKNGERYWLPVVVSVDD